MTSQERLLKEAQVTAAFRPGTPIDLPDLFAGRQAQVQTVFRAVAQQGQHVIIFGEKGVGKTSMARIMAIVLHNAGVTSLSTSSINCDSSDDFSSLWRKIFRELWVAIETQQMGFNPQSATNYTNLDSIFPQRKKITPDDVRYALTTALRISKARNMVIVLDEVDQLPNSETTKQLADTIKNLSDHATPVTIILAGVGDAVDHLIAGHKSIERALVQVKMPRMTDAELDEIIKKGLERVSMQIEMKAKKRIVQLSQGLPHFTHLLSLSSALTAIDHDSVYIQFTDLMAAMRDAVQNSHSLLSDYIKATASPQRESLYEEVLLACGVAEKDELGWFTAASVAKPYSKLRADGKYYSQPYFANHLNEFCMDKRGPVLQRDTSVRAYRYRFINPLMQPFVMIHAQAHGPANAFTDADLTEESSTEQEQPLSLFETAEQK